MFYPCAYGQRIHTDGVVVRKKTISAAKRPLSQPSFMVQARSCCCGRAQTIRLSSSTIPSAHLLVARRSMEPRTAEAATKVVDDFEDASSSNCHADQRVSISALQAFEFKGIGNKAISK